MLAGVAALSVSVMGPTEATAAEPGRAQPLMLAQRFAPPRQLGLPQRFTLPRELVLVGIVLGHPKGPIAVIENRRTREDGLYHVGDVVLGATVLAIDADRAVLRAGDEDIELRLSVSAPSRTPPVAAAPPLRPRPRQDRLRLPPRFRFNR